MALNNSNAAAIDENVTSDNSSSLNGAGTVNATAGATAGPVTTVGRKPNENLVVRIDENSDDNLQALFDSVLKPGVSKRPLQVPFRMRNLPNSFFNPPSVGSKSPLASHSRDDSGDSAIFGSGTTTICSPNSTNGGDNANAGTTPSGVINPITSRLQAIHSRGHSCPASLQETYAGLNTHNAAAVAAAAAAAANNSALSQQQPNRSNQQAQTQPQAQPVPVASPIQPVHRAQRSFDVVSSIQLCEELGELPPGWEQTRTPDGAVYFLE